MSPQTDPSPVMAGVGVLRRLAFDRTLRKGGDTGWYIDLTAKNLHKTSKCASLVLMIRCVLSCTDSCPSLWQFTGQACSAFRPSPLYRLTSCSHFVLDIRSTLTMKTPRQAVARELLLTSSLAATRLDASIPRLGLAKSRLVSRNSALATPRRPQGCSAAPS